MMKIRITAERYGGEYVVGSIPSSTAWYWAKRGEEDFLQLLYGNLDLDTVPEEHQLPDWFNIDNLKHGNNIQIGDGFIRVENAETDEEICIVDLEDEETKVTYDELDVRKEVDKDDCIFYGQSYEKGGWYYEEFEIEGEFDPSKLSFTAEYFSDWAYLTQLKYEGAETFEGDGIISMEDNDGTIKSESYWIETIDEDGDIEYVLEVDV